MFVYNLNQEQQSALLFAAKQIMLADGVFHEDELEMLNLLKLQCIKDTKPKEYSLEELPTLFITTKEKCSFLFELLGIALADNEFHDNEDELLKQYAQALNISNEKLIKLKEWVEIQFTVFNQAQELMK